MKRIQTARKQREGEENRGRERLVVLSDDVDAGGARASLRRAMRRLVSRSKKNKTKPKQQRSCVCCLAQ
jgi:hypothetical protein